jgi:aminoglycoside phosphotransferase (APT) family kinase protein
MVLTIASHTTPILDMHYRRWATLYRVSTDSDRPAVVDALCELTGWQVDAAIRVMTGTHSTPLLQFADDRIRAMDRPRGETVFVHGDIWGGNMLWSGNTCLALIDWKTAGAGDPGVDLGELRMQMAIQYGRLLRFSPGGRWPLPYDQMRFAGVRGRSRRSRYHHRSRSATSRAVRDP